jgi:hypothetical protein
MSFNEIIKKYYNESFDQLRRDGYHLSNERVNEKFKGYFQNLYEFKKDDNYKYIRFIKIYSSQCLDDCERFTGVRDGRIDDLYKEQINDVDDFNDYINLYEDKFMKYKYELQSKKTIELKELCISLGLKRSGSKDDFIERLFVFKFEIDMF